MDRTHRNQQEMNNVVRVGVVTSADPAAMTVRVKVADQDGLVSYNLPVVVRKTLKDKDYWLPDVGEHVVCLFLPFGQEQGFCLGAIYSQADAPPVADRDKRHVVFEDETMAEYDRKEHDLRICVRGGLETSVLKKLHRRLVRMGNALFKIMPEKKLPTEPPAVVPAEDWKQVKGQGYFVVDAGRMVCLNARKILLCGEVTQAAYVPDLIEDEVFSQEARAGE